MTSFHIYVFASTWILSVLLGVLGVNLVDEKYTGKSKIIAAVVLILISCIIACNLIAVILQAC